MIIIVVVTRPVWRTISVEAMDLLKNILTVDANTRFSASEALQHTWVTGTAHGDAHMKPLETMQHTMRARVEQRKPREAEQQQQAMQTQAQLQAMNTASLRENAVQSNIAKQSGAGASYTSSSTVHHGSSDSGDDE